MPRGKRVDKQVVKNIIMQVESNGPLKNRSVLEKAVAKGYEWHQQKELDDKQKTCLKESEEFIKEAEEIRKKADLEILEKHRKAFECESKAKQFEIEKSKKRRYSICSVTVGKIIKGENIPVKTPFGRKMRKKTEIFPLLDGQTTTISKPVDCEDDPFDFSKPSVKKPKKKTFYDFQMDEDEQ
jgi:hypothetical protein